MFECRRKRDPFVGDFCALERPGYCKVEMWIATAWNIITGNNTSGVCVCVLIIEPWSCYLLFWFSLQRRCRVKTCPAHCSGLCATAPRCETFACRDQSWALAFLSNAKKPEMSNTGCLSWVSLPCSDPEALSGFCDVPAGGWSVQSYSMQELEGDTTCCVMMPWF